ncbi:MAG: tRNA dihydrouridine synthase DusB [Bacillota bacterium]|nr:tRNA dihydrouridine synthase DusB [Bacillota bacterium]
MGPSIGAVDLSSPFILAPMAGVTDLAFRLLCKEAGAGLVSTEMISDLALLAGSRRSRALLLISPHEHPVSSQLCGSRPGEMARAARLLVEAGADIVDLNMGCPAPKIVGNREGAALMRHPQLACEIVRAVRESVPAAVPVTAKIRAGWDPGDPSAVPFAQALEQAGVSAVTVHGRYRDQFYRGQADWGVVREVKRAVRVPVIGNGDVRSGADAMRMIEETGCDAVMIGRAVLGNPAVFSDCIRAWRGGSDAGHELPAPDIVAVRHLRMSLALKGPDRGLVEMRKHAAWYVAGVPGAARLRDRLMRVQDPAAVEALLTCGLSPCAHTLKLPHDLPLC